MIRSLILAAFFLLGLGAEPLKPSDAFKLNATAQSDGVTLSFDIADGVYLYQNEIKIFIGGSEVTNLINLPAATEYKDYKIYEGKFSIAVPLGLVLANAADSDDFVLNGDFLGCTKSGFCYQPQQFGFSFKRVVEGYQISKISNSELKRYRSAANSTQISAADSAQSGAVNFKSNSQASGAEANSLANSHAAGNFPASSAENAAVNSDESSAHKNPSGANSISEQDKILNVLSGKSFIAAIALFFGYGVLLSLSPCVYPLIPILSSIIVAKTSSKPSAKTSLAVSLAYIFGMASSYAILGAFVAVFGQNLQGLLQTPPALILTSLIFAALALSMFGFYEIRLPARFQNFLNSKSEKSGGLIGVFSMGLISALVVSPCISAPLAGALVYIAGSGDVLLGAAALFALGLGSGALLLVVGLGGALPRPGAWMEAVPKIFGFLLLFTAVWISRTLIGENLSLLIYAVLGAIFAGFLGLFDGGAGGIKRALALVIALYSALLLTGFASGAKDFSRPLGNLIPQNARYSRGGLGESLQAGEISSAQNFGGAHFSFVRDLAQLQGEIENSKKPVIVDFWASWCKNCEQSERAFADPALAGALDKFSLLKIDLSEDSEQNRAIKAHFNVFGPPTILFFKEGAEITSLRQIGSVNSEKLAEILSEI
ncbi:protein-disulfide reductase DsbD [Campylobacter gracilis]|uniref:Thioredoxin n=1 Tax=Campylobacter gracilis RM3268 TaxID=553220 RepID=C8PE17_9BACT|nr:protein-disulfide reductase DsbD [Campylobacter gracilis]AKT92764.1 thiol:disulfide interchange protein DsbD [Campylobacter gracilis]EEV18890.1 thioredoxin [Campylobacter gracilis RM3268]UEB45062.1 protein-disulfide reductase DsbD [Campylobacter gracilis]SUW82280.1 thiol:disulfide interchange protein DsbD [Campylobacter gracilis]